ncbi:MAG: hypothetical protein ABJB12_01025 [Pseudomonadota bacterium]
MSNADHLHQVCMSLLALPTWTRKALSDNFGWQLDFDGRPPSATKKYRGKVVDPCFDLVTLRQPIYGGKLGWALGLHVQPTVAIPFTELVPPLPARFAAGVHPPAMGGVGPTTTATWRTWEAVGGRMTMQFERAFHSTVELVKGISLGRDRAADPPNFDQTDRYRALACNEEQSRFYVIEERTSPAEKIRVDAVSMRERVLKVSYTCTDPLIGDVLARKLVRHVLLGQLMRQDLEGKVDRIEYTDLESKQSVSKRWQAARDVHE